MNKMYFALMLLIAIIFNGCGQKINYWSPEKSVENVLNKNFEYDEPKEVYVGESMMREKNYFVYEYSSYYMSPDSDFIMHTDFLDEIKGYKEKKYKIMGTTNINKKKYTVLLFADHHRKYENFKLLIDENNKLYNKVLNGIENVVMVYDFVVTPENVYFENTENIPTKEDIIKDKPYKNYEIVFSGITKDTIRLMYREYSIEDMARPSFYQELTYPINTNIIRFKNIKIKVIKVDAEKIKFIVINNI